MTKTNLSAIYWLGPISFILYSVSVNRKEITLHTAQLNDGVNIASDAAKISNNINKYFANIGNDLQKKAVNMFLAMQISSSNIATTH